MIRVILLLPIAFLLLFFFPACDKSDLLIKNNPFVTYIIPEGQQRSTSKVRVYSGDELKFIILFDSTAIYKTVDSICQYSINKLYGLSDCDSKHHENSARFGWRWFNGKMEIFAYCYAESERFSELITTVDIGKEYECSIQFTDNHYCFSINGITHTFKRTCQTSKLRYFLYPYFGGTEAAPHEVRIKIKDL